MVTGPVQKFRVVSRPPCPRLAARLLRWQHLSPVVSTFVFTSNRLLFSLLFLSLSVVPRPVFLISGLSLLFGHVDIFFLQSKVFCSYPVNPSSDHFHTDAVVPSCDHCRTETVLPPSDHYCIEKGAPSRDHYCIDVAVPSSDHCCIETVPPSSDLHGTMKVTPSSDTEIT